MLPENRPVNKVKLRIPVLFLVLAATAIPVELRRPGIVGPTFDINHSADILANIVGYIPVGIVLVELGPLKAIFSAALISVFAEISQLAMMHRDPSFTDVVSNIAGAALGSLAQRRWAIRSPSLRISRWRAVIAVVLLAVVILHVRNLSDDRSNPDGATLPGRIEACWKIGQATGREVLNSSGQTLTGHFRKKPGTRVTGQAGTAAVFDGTNYIDFGHPAALRFTGSMTITAWINASSYSGDDTAIVSQYHEQRGYQLDTTVDRGPRTIGFKLTNGCGEAMARYGKTPLPPSRWSHLAGVYDAAGRTLDVYLNGERDNGFLLGPVSGIQRSARGSLYIGRRGDSDRYNFMGSIGDVRIYSFALTPSQVAADMRGERVNAPARQPELSGKRCGPLSDPEDKEVPADAAILGILAATALMGFWPSARWPLLIVAGFHAGLVLLTVTAANLPAFNMWMLPLVSSGGGASIALSVKRAEP